jgi:hypothetical protein
MLSGNNNLTDAESLIKKNLKWSSAISIRSFLRSLIAQRNNACTYFGITVIFRLAEVALKKYLPLQIKIL